MHRRAEEASARSSTCPVASERSCRSAATTIWSSDSATASANGRRRTATRGCARRQRRPNAMPASASSATRRTDAKRTTRHCKRRASATQRPTSPRTPSPRPCPTHSRKRSRSHRGSRRDAWEECASHHRRRGAGGEEPRSPRRPHHRGRRRVKPHLQAAATEARRVRGRRVQGPPATATEGRQVGGARRRPGIGGFGGFDLCPGTACRTPRRNGRRTSTRRSAAEAGGRRGWRLAGGSWRRRAAQRTL